MAALLLQRTVRPCGHLQAWHRRPPCLAVDSLRRRNAPAPRHSGGCHPSPSAGAHCDRLSAGYLRPSPRAHRCGEVPLSSTVVGRPRQPPQCLLEQRQRSKDCERLRHQPPPRPPGQAQGALLFAGAVHERDRRLPRPSAPPGRGHACGQAGAGLPRTPACRRPLSRGGPPAVLRRRTPGEEGGRQRGTLRRPLARPGVRSRLLFVL
mmetsp:Transcript_1512/g.5351  ORF Transcript_1512/g.5351 Transcript_1512/m.5351 type:complete len:207 (-) Transcript_1512:1386-2006(-)